MSEHQNTVFSIYRERGEHRDSLFPYHDLAMKHGILSECSFLPILTDFAQIDHIDQVYEDANCSMSQPYHECPSRR